MLFGLGLIRGEGLFEGGLIKLFDICHIKSSLSKLHCIRRAVYIYALVFIKVFIILGLGLIGGGLLRSYSMGLIRKGGFFEDLH